MSVPAAFCISPVPAIPDHHQEWLCLPQGLCCSTSGGLSCRHPLFLALMVEGRWHTAVSSWGVLSGVGHEGHAHTSREHPE